MSPCSVSWSRIAPRECVLSQGGGRILARRWRLRRRASQSGMLLLCGGFNGFRGPCLFVSLHYLWWYCVTVKGGVLGGARTPRSSSRSSLWRGMTVTSSISHKNAISGGVSPGGRGNAMVRTRDVVSSKRSREERTADAPEGSLP